MTDRLTAATKVIEEWIDRGYGNPEDNADSAARALDEAGLLAPDLSAITRLTIAGGGKRQLEEWGIRNVELSIQDDGRTLKVFYKAADHAEKGTTMSDHMSLGHARTVATGYGASTVNEQRAARTIVQVGRVADLLDQMADDNRIDANQMAWAAPGAEGREYAYTRAAEIIREAIGDPQ